EIEVQALGDAKRVRVKAIAARATAVSSTQFVLRYELGARGPTAFVHEDPGREAYVMLDFPPIETGTVAPARDVTFVIDRSGSESAQTLAKSRAAVREAIAHL